MDLSWLYAIVDFLSAHKEAVIAVLTTLGLTALIPFLFPRNLTYKYGHWLGTIGRRFLFQRIGCHSSRLIAWFCHTLQDFTDGIITGLRPDVIWGDE